MPQVDFYHLTQSTLDEALVMLVKKCQVSAKKVLVQCPRPAAEAVDDALWTFDPESWLPHGLDDAPGAERADIWVMSGAEENPVSAEFLGPSGPTWPGLSACSTCLMDGPVPKLSMRAPSGKAGVSLMT